VQGIEPLLERGSGLYEYAGLNDLRTGPKDTRFCGNILVHARLRLAPVGSRIPHFPTGSSVGPNQAPYAGVLLVY
jgi:hypothetical protein